MKSPNKMISDYISMLDSGLKSYNVYLKRTHGQYEAYEPLETLKKSYEVQILNENVPFIAIDDVINLKQNLKYHITRKIQLDDNADIYTKQLCCICVHLNVFQLKKELKNLRQKGYKVILESTEKDTNIKSISAIKKKKISKKVIDKITRIESDFLEVFQDKQIIYTINGNLNNPNFPNDKEVF